MMLTILSMNVLSRANDADFHNSLIINWMNCVCIYIFIYIYIYEWILHIKHIVVNDGSINDKII
jgi:hypothetical protein